MKFWKYGRVALALIGSAVLGLSVTSCGVYTSGYMYVTGTQYNQIGAYKIDHDRGYLTPVTGSPFPAAGTNPVQELVLPGGRFLAVVNKGTNNVSMYTIGGAGVLSFQANYSTAGSSPVSLAMDASGQFMYVVDQIAPDGSGRGDISAFQVDSSTGKLTPLTNQNTFNTSGKQLAYFEVNYKPIQIVVAQGFVYVLDQAYVPGSKGLPPACANTTPSMPCSTPDVFLYQINGSGQLILTQNQPLTTGVAAGALSTMATGAQGKYLYLADTAGNRILPFTISSSGVLQTLVGGPVPNNPTSSLPDAILANSNASALYVANFGPSSVNQPNSNIYSFTITTNGQLQPITQGLYPSGSGSIWMVEDPTNQYIYAANFNDNTITGNVINSTTGQLSPLLKGAVTNTVGQPTFVVVTGRVY